MFRKKNVKQKVPSNIPVLNFLNTLKLNYHKHIHRNKEENPSIKESRNRFTQISIHILYILKVSPSTIELSTHKKVFNSSYYYLICTNKDIKEHIKEDENGIGWNPTVIMCTLI